MQNSTAPGLSAPIENGMSAQAGFRLRGRNPDVLSCIANLSNDEVPTPPDFANQILDALTEAWADAHGGADIWADKSLRFLDPCTKSGVFLREITRRLIKGLEQDIPVLQERVDHILTKQVFGIGITHITSLLARRSLYCSKDAQGEHSITKAFTSEVGNVWFQRLEHKWDGTKCRYCHAPRTIFARKEGLETHAYAFIHTDDIKARIAELFGSDMQFDVIIGNPPYQLSSDGGTRDVPIYQHFIEQAKKLEPRFLSMVIPARWMTSGLGLTDFRRTMLTDTRIRELVDYPVSKQVFSSVDVKGGICYFLWDANYDGKCRVTSVREGVKAGPFSRNLSEYDVLVRDQRALAILSKVLSFKETSITTILSVDKQFGWTSNFEGFHTKRAAGDVPLYYIRPGKRDVGFIARREVTKSADLIDKWKVMIPAAGSDGGQRIPDVVLGKPHIAPSPSVCTQSFLFIHVDSERAARSAESYVRTRFFRFLVSLRKITQHATRSTYTWVPMQAWNRNWTDDLLYKKYGITKDEIAFINSMIRPMVANDV